jgi:hypothetical protein
MQVLQVIPIIGIALFSGGTLFYLWLWNKWPSLHEYYRIQILFFGLSSPFGYHNNTWMAQTERRWKGWAILMITCNTALIIACLLILLVVEFPESEGIVLWYGIGILVFVFIFYCTSCGIYCSVVASAKNRDPVRFIWLGVVFGILGLIAAMSVSALNENKPLAIGSNSTGDA